MSKWLENRDKDKENRQSRFNPKYIELKLKSVVENGQSVAEDAKIAHIRFLTDQDEAERVYVHRVLQQGRMGKKFSKEVYCITQDEEVCEYCALPPDHDAYYARRKLLFWVYVYGIYHVLPDKDKKWKKEEYLDTDFYYEPVNAVRLMNIGTGFNDYLEDRIRAWGKRYKTLCDRDYDWVREGFSLDTTYDLMGRDPSEITTEIKKAKKELLSLQEVINDMKPVPAKTEKKIEEGKALDQELDEIFK